MALQGRPEMFATKLPVIVLLLHLQLLLMNPLHFSHYELFLKNIPKHRSNRSVNLAENFLGLAFCFEGFLYLFSRLI
jgi:hypothetical protein